MTLEDYLADQYNRDRQDVAAIEDVVVAVARTFATSFDRSKEKRCWPYQLKTGAEFAAGRPSQGTSAMILAAIGKSFGRCNSRDGSTFERIPNLPKEVSRIFPGAIVGLLRLILKVDMRVKSGTFDDNDPLTISHLAELARGLRGAERRKKIIDGVISTLPEATENIGKLMAESPSGAGFAKQLGEKLVSCAFLALRAIRANADLAGSSQVRNNLYREFFDSRLHEQLSFSSIPDSRFDPADLAFCLEGLLICAREAVDPVLFERVFAVMSAAQETSAHWRPSRPFVTHPTGAITLPLSVEGANSLLRSVEIMDHGKLYDTFAATAIPMFRRFWQWLRARKVEINALGKPCIGWHSEHINETGVIDLWDTSQVLEFLLAFRQLLQRHIARETLVLSRVKIDDPKPPKVWREIADTYEPRTGPTVTPRDRIFDLVENDFVKPWKYGSSSKAHSMLLYGPPGTGKTTIASSIADALSYRLITVTVGDFLGAGGALVEARAKAIFQMLEAQSKCVILFDEIDAFLLDRDSAHYREQDTLFKFLTPGMLTKINDLRKAARSIFIIATNYANRIDPAIKRPGRIDRQYLLRQPDLAKRKEIIERVLRKRLSISAATTMSAQTDIMAKASLYLGFNEIVGAIDQAGQTDVEIIQYLEDTPRSSGHRQYLARLQGEAFPEAEFIAIAEMAAEADKISDLNDAIESINKRDDGDLDKKAWKVLTNRSPKLVENLSKLGVEV